jgi:2-polyprenyl-3-methyl-5-hydroxy-6-metoxy-1,4-benzoquinol methylase
VRSLARRLRDVIRRRRIPASITSRFRRLEPAHLDQVRTSLAQHYHVGWRAPSTYQDDTYRGDVESHLTGRLTTFRHNTIPWLARHHGLEGLRVLEIGCGTGSSTLALAEQGASVVGIDLDLGAMEVARDRLASHGLAAQLREGNAADIGTDFAGQRFDLILYFATLEHMTVPERLASLRQAWELLAPGGSIGVIEAPNRLWFSDGHTSQLPFFNWLPDDLAFLAAPLSPRGNFRELYGEQPVESMEHFLRRGRGVSYHEFILALGPLEGLDVSESLAAFLRRRDLTRLPRSVRRFRRFLMDQAAGVPAAFFEEYLDLLIHRAPSDPTDPVDPVASRDRG